MGLTRIFVGKENGDVEKAINGDKKAFIKLMDENINSFYRVARGVLKIEADVEDSIQNSIIIIYSKIDRLRKPEYFKTWSIKVLINECNKIYNNNKKYVNNNDMAQESSYVRDIEGNIDLYLAIETLPEELRVTTILFYFDDLTYKEISDILSIPEGTVKSRIFRAKERLYKILKEE